jgi:hypothetical protein
MPSAPTKKEAKKQGKPKSMPKQKPKQKQKQRQTNTQKVKVSINLGRGGKAQAQPTIFPTIQLGSAPILPNMIARDNNDKFDKEVIKDAFKQATQEFISQQPRQTIGLANVSAPIDEYLSQQINQVNTPMARKPISVKSSPPALQRFTQVYGNPMALNRSKASSKAPSASGIGSARSDMFSAIASTATGDIARRRVELDDVQKREDRRVNQAQELKLNERLKRKIAKPGMEEFIGLKPLEFARKKLA